MYKKIKNSSFMNLIWFIIATLPFILLLIYSFGFFSTDNNIKKINNIIQYNDDLLSSENGDTIFQNNLINYSIYIGDEQANLNFNDNILSINNFDVQDLDFTYYLNTYNSIDNGLYYLYIKFYTSNSLIYLNIDYYYNNELKNNELLGDVFYKIPISLNDDIDGFTINILKDEQFNNGNFNIKFFMFLTREDINIELIEEQNNWYSLIINNTYLEYLYSINNTIRTNGFISNAFLNLAQFFGVNNVYYSLACYYIEYLLIIVLLHLAFDLLYMVPNICHKFMEKIGGERD